MCGLARTCRKPVRIVVAVVSEPARLGEGWGVSEEECGRLRRERFVAWVGVGLTVASATRLLLRRR